MYENEVVASPSISGTCFVAEESSVNTLCGAWKFRRYSFYFNEIIVKT